MNLWIEWFSQVRGLRDACSNIITFGWMIFALMGFSIRPERVGVTSFVRALGLRDVAYKSLLNFFHSKAMSLNLLTDLWIKLCCKLFVPLSEDGLPVLVGDGIKVPKEGRKMPAVKCLHQESNDNSKPEYIMGHSLQAICLLAVSICGLVFAVPLASRIHEGVVTSNRDKKTLVDRMAELLESMVRTMKKSVIFVVDNYYGNKKIVKSLTKLQSFLVSRLRNTAVAEYPANSDTNKRGPGRKKKYGKKVALAGFFKKQDLFVDAASPVYGESGVTLSYYCINLLWRPVGHLVRFVLVNHPSRGKIILMTTKTDLSPIRVIALYGYRFKIEVTFKQALHTIGKYAYHFWMRDMVPIKRQSGNQYLHRKPKEYRDAVARKIGAYHCFIQLGCIAHGLLQHLAINFSTEVWGNFRSWLRTMKKNQAPSELVVSYALRSSLPEFLVGSPEGHDIEKLLNKHADPNRTQGLTLAGTG